MTRLYVAGPMTGYEDYNYPAFRAAAEQLQSVGYETENPADNDDGAEHSYEWYLRAGFAQVLRCDGVALLDGWEHSKGAWHEVTLAKALNMPYRTVAGWVHLATVERVA